MASGDNDRLRLDRDDELVDELLRQEFARSFAGGERSHMVLNGLGPSIRRARRVHRAKQVVLGAAAGVALLSGLSVVNRLAVFEESELTVAGETKQEAVKVDVEEGEHRELTVTLTTVESTTRPSDPAGDDGQAAERDEGMVPTTGPSSEPVSSGRDSTSTSQPSSASTTASAPTSTTSLVSTSIGPDGTTTLISRCGSLVVKPTGDRVELIEILPDPGVGVDIKESGPTEIEVGMEGNGRHCELKVRAHDGRIITNDGPESEHERG
ncbi:MAG: hypothetical protein OER95_07990 [Acidimicrobiia bacterium]|nr:hypothetical protein [Acidimicrobiia bacterium]